MKSGDSTTVGSTDSIIQFTAEEPLFVMAYFITDSSSFRIEFRRTFTMFESSSSSEPLEVVDEDVFAKNNLRPEDLFMLIFVIAIAISILGVLITICIRLK